MIPTYLSYWLTALHLPGVGTRKFLQWLQSFSNIKELFHASCDELAAKGITSAHHYALQNPNWKAIDEDLEWQNTDRHLITYDDDDYPALLKETADPPLVLYLRGDKSVLSNLQIAMVGSRKATSMGLKNAEQFAYCLASAGVSITSGLALGIDGASHRGALAANGVTIGVAGTGLKYIYPAAHRSLIDMIINNCGAIISEFPLMTAAHAVNFPRRNRIISGLSVGVIVVEAALKSGSLITARLAFDQGREVFAIPGSIHNPLTRGCHHLIRQGAKLVETVEDIFAEVGSFGALLTSPAKQKNDDLTKQESFLLEKIEYEITSMDVIILRSRLTGSELSSILLALELKGYIRSVPGGYIRVG